MAQNRFEHASADILLEGVVVSSQSRKAQLIFCFHNLWLLHRKLKRLHGKVEWQNPNTHNHKTILGCNFIKKPHEIIGGSKNRTLKMYTPPREGHLPASVRNPTYWAAEMKKINALLPGPLIHSSNHGENLSRGGHPKIFQPVKASELQSCH